MGCCGRPDPNAAARTAAASAPTITGYLVELPDGRSATYLTEAEANVAHTALGSTKPVRPVYSVR